MPRRVVVVGAAGRLGRVVCEELASSGHQVVAFTRTDLDITDFDTVKRVIPGSAPQVVINCTAYNAVDAAETDTAAAFAVNAHGPGLLAKAADSVGALFVHYGTDFVFDGTSRTLYTEDDAVNPLSAYGSSKLAGETAIQRATDRHYILRVESLFGGAGLSGHRATIDQIADTLLAGGTVRALVDRTVSPSYVPDVARATRELLDREAPYGIYHCVNSGFTTWYDLAHEVARQLSVTADIVPVAAADLKTTAPRPVFCALSNRKLAAFGIDMPSWQSAIRRHLASRRAETTTSASVR
jgi:dTDP-4-dehydrorhamnose reductase